jgi:hypothetical protein
MTASTSLEQGQAAFERQAWGNAYQHLTAAAREAALGVGEALIRSGQTAEGMVLFSQRGSFDAARARSSNSW